MTNPFRGEAVLKDGATEYKLVLDIEAMIAAETEFGLTMAEMLAKLSTGLALAPLRALLWAALQRHHACPPAEATGLMSRIGPPQVLAAISGVIRQAFPPPQEGGDKDPPAAPEAGTG